MRSAAVIGTGAVGTSVALALVRHGVSVYLEDSDSTAARTAEAMGAGSLEAVRAPVDLAVVAVPPARVAGVLARVQNGLLARAYTDVAGLKAGARREVVSAGVDPSRYIGGHPLTGAGRPGPLAGRADLFENRPWVLTPSAGTARDVLNRVLELVALCGATPVVMDGGEHDRSVALTSHAPHLVAALMAARLEHAPPGSMRVLGQGVRDVTRGADGNPALWGEVLGANADAVADVLEAYGADLDRAVQVLRALGGGAPAAREHAAAELDALLRRGNRGHERVEPGSGPAPGGLAAVTVTLSDRPGSLSRVFAAVGEAGVDIEDIRIDHTPGQPQGLVELRVRQETAAALCRRLDAAGWTVSR
ncbi:prephenate dehydrogenase [Kitasatospora sp. RG8]|uniref:prephenate dehydrogenase n=1 Tax=Kitasatospora sp. RG8 TaxID=2820815 RepID=UPI001AE07C6B|nr:prephenate dehydrogenase [Kitasatospora sp. RG8]MBP0453264.1 prephenate dehydrogenase [Kitasatospora sp. RG8]